MSAEVFDYPPSVELLKWLTPGSLKQNLAKALRLWVILRSLYGDEPDEVRLQLGEQFTYEQWREQFFTQTKRVSHTDKIHHQRDEIPILHDPECRCTKTLQEWLFKSNLSIEKNKWCQSFQQLYPITLDELENLLSSATITQKLKKTSKKSLPEGRLFAVTGKNLEYDFETLVKLGWLQLQTNEKGELQRNRFCKVSQFPTLAVSASRELLIESELYTHLELASFHENFSQKINGIQRFFIHVEYIVHEKLSEQVQKIQSQLKSIWEKDLVSVIKLTYRSARRFQDIDNYIVYPVCIYYYQRAPYLFAYGQTPLNQNEDKWSQIDWYDYRMDRIEDLKELKWIDINELTSQTKLNSKKIQELENSNWVDIDAPQHFIQKCQGKYPPSPQEVKNKMAEAWGFDFYNPQELLLLRFERYFHSNYIAGTERTELFKEISHTQAKRLIVSAKLTPDNKQSLLSILQSRSESDIYCTVSYRVNDNNVVMRLRAWGPKVEVLLPWDLRSRIAKDLQDTWKLYK